MLRRVKASVITIVREAWVIVSSLAIPKEKYTRRTVQAAIVYRNYEYRVDATANSKDVVEPYTPLGLGPWPPRRYGSVRRVGSVRGTARVLFATELAVGHKNWLHIIYCTAIRGAPARASVVVLSSGSVSTRPLPYSEQLGRWALCKHDSHLTHILCRAWRSTLPCCLPAVSCWMRPCQMRPVSHATYQ